MMKLERRNREPLDRQVVGREDDVAQWNSNVETVSRLTDRFVPQG